MTYARLEEIPVWQEAIRLVEGVYDMTESKTWPGSRSLQDQLECAALSVSNNIAEGFERGTTNELLAFIYIARGSAGRSPFHAVLPGAPPCLQKLQISKPKFEIIGRELFTPIARLGGLSAELGDQRPAIFKRKIAAAI
jgi:hypothetical protein